MDTKVQLTDGTVKVSALGKTLIHEHVLVGMPGWNMDLKAPKFIRSEAMARAIDRIQELHAYGCNSMIDPCPMDIGRDAEFIAEVAQRSGINIVCATGVYNEFEGTPYTFRTMPAEDILELYVKEITEGIGDTGIKAGVIKIATHGEPTEYERKMISVATQASLITGAPIISHTQLASHGHDQIDIVESCHGHANCMVVGHSGDRDDHGYQASLARRGAFVGLDRFGLDFLLPDDARMKNLMQLVAAGLREHVVISQDYPVCLLGRFGVNLEQIAPNWGITHIFKSIIPRLKEMGLTDEDVETILVSNPRQLFANAAAQKQAASH
ncbi:phosphotriesterase-related protein [Paraburkholderia sp. GAS448]|uniref:phosphotriesterase family protein n=1 Tax=Paraburkholderia sp. GAS448 TaxID=3035136 RepID=UPI003D1A1076